MEKVKNVIKNRKVQIVVGSVVIGGTIAYVAFTKSHALVGQEGVILTAPEDISVKAGDVVKIVGETKTSVKAVKVPKAIAA